MPHAVNLQDKFAKFEALWAPKVIAELNDYQIKVVKLAGEFVWHKHDHTDEMFLCVAGEMKIALRDATVMLTAGELYVVPRGTEHRPFAEGECHALIIEPRGVINTGDEQGNLTAPNDEWV